MSEDTAVLPALPARRVPAPALVPGLIVGAFAFALAACFFYVQSSRNAEALAETRSQNVTLKDELGKAQQKAAALEVQVAAQQRELDQGAPVPLPVDVTFRAGRPGTGLVARMQNFSNGDLSLAIRVSRPMSGERREFTLNLPLHGLSELGREEGWAFQSGDTLAVQSGSYQPLSYRVP
jgi:hypothetical protein